MMVADSAPPVTLQSSPCSNQYPAPAFKISYASHPFMRFLILALVIHPLSAVVYAETPVFF